MSTVEEKLKLSHDESKKRKRKRSHSTSDGDSDDEQPNFASQCPKCYKFYNRRSNLTRHMKIHAGARPNVCSEPGCGRAFREKHHLATHARGHSGERPFACSICKQTFPDASNCKRHEKTVCARRSSSSLTKKPKLSKILAVQPQVAALTPPLHNPFSFLLSPQLFVSPFQFAGAAVSLSQLFSPPALPPVTSCALSSAS